LPPRGPACARAGERRWADSRRPAMRRLLTMLALALAATVAPLVAAPLMAQKLAESIPRPKLRDVTDTNDAQAYFDAVIQRFRSDPRYAADAFYWATRLNPGWADPLYGRR